MFYQGSIVRGEDVHEGWVSIEWLDPGKNKFSAVKDVRQIERRILAEGRRGWLAASERDHTTMHKILVKMGAHKYQESPDELYFMKEVR